MCICVVPSWIRSMTTAPEKTAELFNSMLPVCLTAEDVENNPGFVTLLTVISKHVHKSGASLPLQKDLEQAESELRKEKAKWLRQHVLYRELQELLLDNQVAKGADFQFYKAVDEMLTLAEISDYLPCNPDPSSDATLLGLTQQDIDLCNKHKKHKESMLQKLIPEIETHLRKRCEALVSYHDDCTKVHDEESGSQEPAFVKASQLPLILEEEQLKLQENKQLICDIQANIDRQIKVYTKLLMESLETLETIITKFKLETQSHNDKVTCQWLGVRCETICAKVKLVQLELMCNMYYSDTVKALSKIKKELDKTRSNTEKEIAETKEVLKVYEGVGVEFEQLVEEYARLKFEIDNNKWAIRTVTKSPLDSDVAD